MKSRHLFLLLLAVLLFGACRKEHDSRLELLLEPMDHTAAKLAVSDDSVAVWDDGDLINLNGVPVSVSRVGGHAYIDASSSQAVNRACFPADLVSSFSDGDEVTVHLPAAYHYRTDGSGAQQVDMPLAACAAEGSPLMFRHLTAALCVVLTNSQRSGEALVIDSISVSSDSYRLSGDCALDMNAIEAFEPQALGAGGTDNRVTLFFDRQRLEIPYGGSHKVLIPVPPVGTSNHFTVTVAARCQGKRYNYSKTQTTGGALDRRVLAYAPMPLSGTYARNLFAGEGSRTTPYQIKNACDWIAMSEAVSGGWARGTSPGVAYRNGSYKLVNSIDLDGITLTPIENYTNAAFDGNGKTVSNLTIEGSGDTLGLFRSLTNVKISNFTLDNVTLNHSGTSAELFVGLITGHLWGSDTLDHCHVAYSQTLSPGVTNNAYYGGLIGICGNKTSTTTTICVSNCSVTNSPLQLTTSCVLYAGGLLGCSRNKITLKVQDCSWSGNMSFACTGTSYVGRLIGAYFQISPGSLTVSGNTASGTLTVNGEERSEDIGKR